MEEVLGLELDPRGVAAAGENARRNGVEAKVRFVESHSYQPVSPEGRRALERFRGAADFILANPPSSSPVGDGFEVRRVVVRGAPEYLKTGGVLLLSVSTQYGAERVSGLVSAHPGFVHEGVAATTDLVPFDMERPDLRRDVLTYAREEERGGLPYAFRDPRDPEREMTAVEAWARHEADGESPLSRWQNHLLGLGGLRKGPPVFTPASRPTGPRKERTAHLCKARCRSSPSPKQVEPAKSVLRRSREFQRGPGRWPAPPPGALPGAIGGPGRRNPSGRTALRPSPASRRAMPTGGRRSKPSPRSLLRWLYAVSRPGRAAVPV